MDTSVKSKRPDEILPPPYIQEGSEGFEASRVSNSVQFDAFAATGLACAEDLSKETDIENDYKTHKFLDLNKPLLMQVWFGGFSKDFYLGQVHMPRHYKGGESAPIFGNFLEPLSKASWWVIPMIWLPPVMYGTYISREGCKNWAQVGAYWSTGLLLWTLVEYILHRFLFHLDK